MRRALLTLAVALGGCDLDSGPAAFDVQWFIRINGVPSTCAQADADVVTFDFRRVDNGDTLTFEFDCRDGAGLSTASLRQNVDYDATVTLWRGFDGSNPQVLATRSISVVFFSRVNILPDVLFDLTGSPASSAFRATWTILDELGDPISCEEVPADTMEFIFDNRDTGDRDTFLFDCADGNGALVTSDAVLFQGDTYDVTVTLLFHFELPDEQVVGTQAFEVTPTTALFDFPQLVFDLGG